MILEKQLNKKGSFKKRMSKTLLNKGFTLVELIIVMSIIGILVTLGVVSYRSAQIKTRDVGRKSDLKQYQNALEVYASGHNGLYPFRGSPVSAATTLCSDLSLPKCPEDPRPPSAPEPYGYVSTNTGGSGVAGTASADKYVLYAYFEGSPERWVVCSDGRSGVMPATAASPTGVCPL